MIGGDAYVRRTLADHLKYGIENSGNRTESSLFATGGATQSIEMAEELVSSVNQMNDHVDIMSKLRALQP